MTAHVWEPCLWSLLHHHVHPAQGKSCNPANSAAAIQQPMSYWRRIYLGAGSWPGWGQPQEGRELSLGWYHPKLSSVGLSGTGIFDHHREQRKIYSSEKMKMQKRWPNPVTNISRMRGVAVLLWPIFDIWSSMVTTTKCFQGKCKKPHSYGTHPLHKDPVSLRWFVAPS